MMKKKKNFVSFPPSDPRSVGYERKLDYPEINMTTLLIKAIAPIPVASLCSWAFAILTNSDSGAVVFFILSGVYSLFNVKKIILSTVKSYQRLAPTKVRQKCRFEPSCSQYMILAVEKYGAVKGLYKGIKRLSKCNDRGDGTRGGYDYP